MVTLIQIVSVVSSCESRGSLKEHRSSAEADTYSQLISHCRTSRPLEELEGSLPSEKQPVTGPYPKPIK